MRIQPKFKRPGSQRSQREDPRVTRCVDETAAKFDVSKSWVRHTALAHYFGIDIIGYDEENPMKRRRRGHKKH